VTSAVETLEPTKVRLTVDVSAADLSKALSVAYAAIARDIQVPGFRKGKVPARIIDQRIGFDSVLDFAIKNTVQQWYTTAAREAKVHPLGPPEIDVTDQPDSAQRDQGLTFTAEVEVRPVIVLPELTSLTVTVPSVAVNDDELDSAMGGLAERFASLRGVDRPAASGDFVSMDLKATIGDREVDSVSGISYEVGEETMLKGLDEALDGLSAGETTVFETELAGGAHEGERALVEVTVQSVKEREMPVLDDDFAMEASEFDTIEELREDMAKHLALFKQKGQLGQARQGLVETLLADLDFPVPPGVLAREIEEYKGFHDDEEAAREIATMKLRESMLLDALSEHFDIQVSQDELVQSLLRAAQEQEADPSEFVEQVQAQGLMPLFIGDISHNKAIDQALLRVRVEDEDGDPVDLTELLAQDHNDDDDIEFDE